MFSYACPLLNTRMRACTCVNISICVHFFPLQSFASQTPALGPSVLSFQGREFTWLHPDSISLRYHWEILFRNKLEQQSDPPCLFSISWAPLFTVIWCTFSWKSFLHKLCVCVFVCWSGGVSDGRVKLGPVISSCLEAGILCMFLYRTSIKYKSSNPDISVMESPRWHHHLHNPRAVASNNIQYTRLETRDRKRNTVNIISPRLKIILFLPRLYLWPQRSHISTRATGAAPKRQSIHVRRLHHYGAFPYWVWIISLS